MINRNFCTLLPKSAKKNQNCLFKMKFDIKANNNMLNLIVGLTFLFYTKSSPFGRVEIEIKIICLS